MIRKFDTGATRDTNEGKLEIAWAAGFYDGEGSISCGSNNGNPHTRIQLGIGQKNYNGEISDTLKKFKKIVGCGHIYQKTKTGKEINQHQFIISKSSDVKLALNLLWQHLSTAKKEQARLAIHLFEDGIKKLNLKLSEKKNENI